MSLHKAISFIIVFFVQFNAVCQNFCEKICKERIISCYDIIRIGAQPTDPADIARWQELLKATPAYIHLLYNFHKQQNTCLQIMDMSSSFLSGTASATNPARHNMITAGLPVPIGSGQEDYVLFGEATPRGSQTGTYFYTLKLSLLNAERHIVKEATGYVYNDLGMAVNGLLLDLFDGGHKSLAQIIYEFEKSERDDQKMNNMAFNPGFEKKAKYDVKANEMLVIDVALKDCDKFELNKRTLRLTASSGKLEKDVIKTDNGYAGIIWTAPDKAGDQSIRLSFKYDLPSGKRDQEFSDDIKINVYKPREEFNAILEVKAITISKQFDIDGNLESKTESEDNYSVNQVLTFNDVLFERLEKKIQNLDYCVSKGGCVLLQGNNDLFKPTPAEPIGKKNSPVKYSFTSKDYSKCDGNLILTRSSEGNGSTTDYMVTDMITIYKYNKADEDFKPLPLVKNKADMDDISPLPLTNATHFAQLSFWLGYFNPSPGNSSLKRYDCTIKKWENSDEKSGGPSGGFEDREKSVNQNGSISYYVNPVIPEIELMNYLRNPIGAKTFHINARSYKKEANTETQTDFYITLTLY